MGAKQPHCKDVDEGSIQVGRRSKLGTILRNEGLQANDKWPEIHDVGLVPSCCQRSRVDCVFSKNPVVTRCCGCLVHRRSRWDARADCWRRNIRMSVSRGSSGCGSAWRRGHPAISRDMCPLEWRCAALEYSTGRLHMCRRSADVSNSD
jgi:hypothetical protein